MPTSRLRNLAYLAALPLLAPSPRGQMTHAMRGGQLNDLQGYERILKKHHVLGSSLLLADGERTMAIDTSVADPAHKADADTLYRVASITKMATALVTLSLVRDGALMLDDEAAALLPGGAEEPALRGVTVRHLLSHQSALCDVSAMDEALRRGGTWHDVLRAEGVRSGVPGGQFRYCNLGFGLLGCILEQVSGTDLAALYRERLFEPLGMRAALDASTLDETHIMPISRVFRYRKGQDVTVTPLGRKPLTAPDPERHFGHSAGAMYTDAPSLLKLLRLLAGNGAVDGDQLLPESLVLEMKRSHASYGKLSPGMEYGLGLVLLHDPLMSAGVVYGHQGYAYGCADGAFLDETTGRAVVFLNGGCSEAREGRLGLCNRDVLRWALGKELPSWR